VRQVPGKAATPRTRLVELPGRGVTRVWECAGPPGAETLMLIHGVTFTAELNWGKVFAPLSRHFRVIAIDLRGHGDGIRTGSQFRLEDCADDMVAQMLYRRHPSLLSGLVLCATARNVLGSPAEKLVALALPTAAAAIRWNPFLQPMTAELLGMALMGPVDDPVMARQARAQLRRTTLGTAISAVQAVCEFSSHSWIGEVDVPAAVVVTAQDRIVPVSRQLRLARAIPGASVHEVDADHAVCVTRPQLFVQALLEACWSVAAARAGQEEPGLTGTAL
jgi:3-oxoadipate enol-lactonase